MSNFPGSINLCFEISIAFLCHVLNIHKELLSEYVSVYESIFFLKTWILRNMYVYIFGLLSVIVKNLPDNAGDSRDMGLHPGSGRFPGGGNGNPLLYSCLRNPMDRRAWQVTVHGIARS